MKINAEMIQRDIAGEHILIPTGATALKLHGMLTLTETGLTIWKKLQSDCSEEDLIEAILAEYEGVDRETAAADVNEFLKKLEKLEILEH